MIPIPGPGQLAQWFLKILRDLGYWKPADPQRPPAPPLPSDPEFTSTQMVLSWALTMNNTEATKAHMISLKNWLDVCPHAAPPPLVPVLASMPNPYSDLLA